MSDAENDFDDTPITIGVVRRSGVEGETAVVVMKYDRDLPAADRVFLRYEKMTLEVMRSEDGGVLYYISGVERPYVDGGGFNGTSAEDLMRLVEKKNIPNFAAYFGVSPEYHERFTKAKIAKNGLWLLVTLTAVATEVEISGDDRIIGITHRPREDYEEHMQE